MEFFKQRTNFRFMPLRSRWYAISAVLLVASLALIGIRGLNLGIDFTGGVVLELSFPQAADLDKVRGALAAAGHEDATVQSFGTANEVLVRLLPKEGEDTAAVGQDVLESLKSYEPVVQLRRTEVVGAQIGKERGEQCALSALKKFAEELR